MHLFCLRSSNLTTKMFCWDSPIVSICIAPRAKVRAGIDGVYELVIPYSGEGGGNWKRSHLKGQSLWRRFL